jgi:hypothetical protein
MVSVTPTRVKGRSAVGPDVPEEFQCREETLRAWNYILQHENSAMKLEKQSFDVWPKQG